MKSLHVAVLFGSQSPEHEVSIITALQVMHALKEAGHTIHPIYITKQGVWLQGDERFLDPKFYANLNQAVVYGKIQSLTLGSPTSPLMTKELFNQWKPSAKIDVAFPIFHGDYGEDGSIQGLLKLLGVPIVGSTLTQTTVGIDKYLTKRIAQSIGIPVLPDILVTHTAWQHDADAVCRNAFQLGKQLIIKPNRLGSSIGISIAKNKQEFEDGIAVALQYDTRVLVEPLLDHPTEINVAIMGNDPYQFSATEQPIKDADLLSFQDKYLRDGGKKTGAKGMASGSRLIPAPISKAIDEEIKTYARTFFQAIDGKGQARLDFMISDNRVYFNEINTIPGSLAFYLWDKVGVSFTQLVDELLSLSLENFQKESKLIKSFESNLLASMPLNGK